MMLDVDVVAVSPSTTYRVLKAAEGQEIRKGAAEAVCVNWLLENIRQMSKLVVKTSVYWFVICN